MAFYSEAVMKEFDRILEHIRIMTEQERARLKDKSFVEICLENQALVTGITDYEEERHEGVQN